MIDQRTQKCVGRLIRRHFLDGLPTADARRMREHIRRCERCRDDYDRHATVARVAAERAPTRRDAAAAWARIEAALDAPTSPGAREPLRAEGLLRWLPLAAAAAVLITLAIGVLRPAGEPPRRPIVQYRGGGVTPHVALEIHAVQREAAGYGPPRLLQDGATLDLRRDLLQLRYRNADPALAYLYVLGLDGRGRALDYYPRPSTDGSLAIEAGGGVEPHSLGRSIRLAARHQAGPLRVVAVFSAQRLTRSVVHGALAASTQGGDGAPLPATLDLELTGAGRVVTVVRSFAVRSLVGRPSEPLDTR